MARGFVAGVDLGTTRAKLVVFDEEGRVVDSLVARSPLYWGRGLGVHGASALRRLPCVDLDGFER